MSMRTGVTSRVTVDWTGRPVPAVDVERLIGDRPDPTPGDACLEAQEAVGPHADTDETSAAVGGALRDPSRDRGP